MKNTSIIRSSAAEYLTFVAATGSSEQSFEMRYEDENIWLTQKMMATLYDVEVPTINEHIAKIYADNELGETATIRNFRIVQTEGSRQVNRDVKHYNLQMIIAVGFKVNNERANHRKEHMGLTTWEATPEGKIQKFNVSVAKNYLAESEFEKYRIVQDRLFKSDFDKLIEAVGEG